MENAKTLIYDGSFNGFLTSIFMSYQEIHPIAGIVKTRSFQNRLFVEGKIVETQTTKAKRVWNAIQQKNNKAIRNIYFAFLSEAKGIEWLLYRYIKHLFGSYVANGQKFREEDRIKVAQLAHLVAQEKKQKETHTTFQLSKDNIYYAAISAGYNVLPLLTRYFRSVHALQPWVLYDEQRNYGFYYNLKTIELINFDLGERSPEKELGKTLRKIENEGLLTAKKDISTLSLLPYLWSTENVKKNTKTHFRYNLKKAAV